MNRVKIFLKKYGYVITMALSIAYVLLISINPAYADYKTEIKNVVASMIDIIGFIFKAIGVILGTYSVGQLILAFKNEDADSKSRASTQLVVSIALISAPAIITKLDLLSKLG